MEANVWPVGQVFNRGGEVHYILPRFQRPYAWEQNEWQALWDDLLEVHEAGQQSRHFLGAIVVVEEENRGHVSTYTLIDGQQRLLTLSLLLHALAQETNDKTLRARITDYLTNQYEEGSLRYKVLPTDHYGDREAWLALVAGRKAKAHSSSRVVEAHRFFCRAISQSAARRGIVASELFNTLIMRMQVVFINLRREERPHQIFESLNARGRPLEQADLVRNYLAMRLPASEQDSAYQHYWLPIQDMFEETRSAGISDFLLNYLASKSGVFYREDETYRQFRKRMDSEFSKQETLVSELATMHRHAEYFAKFLKPDGETNSALRLFLVRFNALERTVVRPLLLRLFDAQHRQKLSLEELLDALNLLDNYITRHFLANYHTGGLRRFLASLVRVESLQDLKRRLHTRNYPDDKRLRNVLSDIDLYRSAPNRRRLVYILMRVNHRMLQDRDVTFTLKDAPTIEHIMPRSLSEDWERHLRNEWEDFEQGFEYYLNSLGNLTLVTQSWNSIMSNSSWHKKRKLLREHGLPLNNQYFSEGRLGDVSVWNEKAIVERESWIIDAFLELWPDQRENNDDGNYDPERHPRPGFDYRGSGVTEIALFNKQLNVYGNAWNNATQMFTNELAVPRADFEEIMRDMEVRKLARSGGYKQLDNGLWLDYMNPNEAVTYMGELADLCELDESDWSISVKFYD
ncbi:MAG: DUF262 domain-containing protein [Anaerolineaceae bacterium]|nr:DUF262 domain-containing protein [Anaerolineaceae bacterium]